MAIDKLIPQYLNSDTDQKLVKSVEMTDNLNVRVSNDGEGTAGVIKNIKGTDVVGSKTSSDDFPSGENRVIGAVDNERNKEIIFLLWNNSNNHGIYRLDMTSGKYQKLYQDSVLNFRKFSHVDCDVVVNEEGDTLFYWTDNINPPMKLNINRIIGGKYPTQLTSGTTDQKLLCLTVAKQPPLTAPKCTPVNNNSLGHNNISEKVFQFAYKYVYEDGEHSALSPYSEVSFAENLLKDYFITDGKKDFFNQIDVQVVNTTADAKEIILYVRENTSQTFYEIEKINNVNGTSSSKISFSNNKLGRPLSKDEILKSYDNVPQRARTLALTNNRLFFGNYTEGYPNIDTDIKLLPNYASKPDVYDISVSILPPTTPSDEKHLSIPRIELDLTALPGSIPANSILNLNFIINMNEVNVGGNDYNVENILLDPGQLQVMYRKTDDSTSVEIDTVEIAKIKGDPFLSNAFSNYLDLFYTPYYNAQFNPALSFKSEGLYVKEIIEINSATTPAGLLPIISSKLSGQTFDVFLNPVDNARRLSVLETDRALNVFSESGCFNGTATFKFSEASTNGDKIVFDLKMQHIDIELFEFFFNSGKTTNVVSTNRIRLNAYTTIPSVLNREVTPYIYDAEIVEGASGVYKSLDGNRSFKSGANHKLGIVYLDDRGRASGVQEAGDVFIESLNKRSLVSGQDGASSVVMRVNHQPPSWASKWAPVYTGQGGIELGFMYSVSGAFAPKNNLDQSTASSTKNKIYISVNSLFGDEGFNKSLGADIQYKFEKGDKLRIIDYGRGSKYTNEFKVIGFERLGKDEDSNPILDKINEDARTITSGEFIIVEDNGVYPFNYSSVINENSKFFDNCIVEVYRNRKELDDEAYVYYGLGKSFDITNNSHNSERPAGSSITALVTALSTSAGVKKIEFTSAGRLFSGDIITDGTDNITVDYVELIDGLYYYYCSLTGGVFNIGISYTLTISNTEPVVEITHGDVYFRPRLLLTASKQIDQVSYKSAGSTPAIVDFIEDYSVSDFFDSKQTTKGKPYAYIPDNDTIRRVASITYSDAYVLDSGRLNLSSFNLSTANWKDMEVEHGQIDKIVPRADSITVLQNSKASQLPTSRNLIEYADGKSQITASNKVLGTPKYYAGDFGTSGNPEAVVERFGILYYVDSKAAKVIRLSADGITPISENGLDSFFEDKFKSLISETEKIRVVGGFDPENNEYLITVEPVYNVNLNVGSGAFDVPSDADAEFTIQGITYTSSTVIWNAWGNLWDIYCGEWQNVGNGIVFVDSVFQAQSILVDSSFLGSTSTIKVIVTDTSYSFSAIADLNLSTGKLTMPSTTCEGDSITIGNASLQESGFTIAYKHKEKVWGSKYSFTPTMYVNINNELYSFSDNSSGLVWKHNSNDTRNNFYGAQYDSEIEVVSNRNPSMVKVFESLAVEGGGTWSGTLTTSDQSTTIGVSDFSTKEGHRYAMIPRDTLVSTGHQIYLGKVDSVSTDKVTFTTPVNKIPFLNGDILKTASGSVLNGTGMEISGITDRKTVQCTSNISNISAGDNVFVEHSSRIDGDPMRDVFLKIKLTSSDTTAFEVHALSLSYDRSRLHNDRVN